MAGTYWRLTIFLTTRATPNFRPPGGRAHDVLDRNQTAIQELEEEEDKTTTRHVRFKTRHPRAVDDLEFESSSGLEWETSF